MGVEIEAAEAPQCEHPERVRTVTACPYQWEINDKDVLCVCCDECRQECTDGI